MGKILFTIMGVLIVANALAQDIKTTDVPSAVKTSLGKKFPEAKGVHWEKENGNFEANWGGKSGEDHSAQFNPSGDFVELVDNIPVSSLPAKVVSYVKDQYKTNIREAGKRTEASGKLSYEVEIKGKDLIFGLDGTFIRESH
jgi:hypothetical protein